MGRPLKIAKAQAVITITATTSSTKLVTTSANFTNLGIIAGMPFITATTVGGLIGGTTYWILNVLNSGNNSTFTVSATPLNANPNSTPFTLTTTTTQTISTTVAPVDGYFNNPNGGVGYPATNANTYSVVGGNTAIYGKQVLCNVAIGANGTGTLYASNASTVLGGIGTDFGNISNNTIIQAYNSSGSLTTLGYVANNFGTMTVAITNATATGNFLTTSGTATNLTANLPVTLDADIGGLTANTVYFVKTIPNATAFTVSLTVAGANIALADEDAAANAIQNITILAANSSTTEANVNFLYASPEAGYIIRQKGKQKYLVKGTTSGLVGSCYTANVANTAMTPNSMTITATYANASTVNVQSLSDHTAELFTATSGPIATGNIVIANADPAYTTFNTAIAADANVANAQPYPIVQIGNL